MNRKFQLIAIVTAFVVLGSVMLVPASHAQSTDPVVKVVSASWYSPNSTIQVSPNDSYVPLIVTVSVFEAGPANWENFSINLGSSGYFSYSYVIGPDSAMVDYENLTFPSSTGSTHLITLEQLVNISDASRRGIYEMYVHVTSNLSTSSQNVPFQIGLLGTPSVTLVNYFTNPPVIYQDEKYIKLDLVFANSGLGPYQNFNVSVSSQNFTVLTSAYHIPYFASGATENLTFLISAHNVTGVSPIALYFGSSESIISPYIHSHGQLAVTSTVPALQPGTTKDLEQFNLTNTGNTTMYDLQIHLISPSVISIHISSSNPLDALTANNVTIGELLPGQKITVTFLVDVSSSALTQNYPAQLVIQWYSNNSQDQFMQVYNFNEKVTPTPIQQIRNSLTFTPLNIAVLIVIIALIGALIAVAARGRKIRKEMTRQNKVTMPSLEHKEISSEKDQK